MRHSAFASLISSGADCEGAERRARRVGILLLITLTLSLFDLVLTLSYARSIGLIELNPIAAWIMRQGPSHALIAWKLGSVGLACCIIYAIRHRREGEGAAWVSVLVLAALTVHWLNFGNEVHTLTAMISDPANIPPDSRWIIMAD